MCARAVEDLALAFGCRCCARPRPRWPTHLARRLGEARGRVYGTLPAAPTPAAATIRTGPPVGGPQPLTWNTNSNLVPPSRAWRSIVPRALRYRPVPPVMASTLSLAS